MHGSRSRNKHKAKTKANIRGTGGKKKVAKRTRKKIRKMKKEKIEKVPKAHRRGKKKMPWLKKF